MTINPGILGFCTGEDRKIAIDEEQAAVVCMIFQNYLDGRSLMDIKRSLEAMGVKTASGRNNRNTAVIQNMLSQEKYRGDATLQKTYRASLFDHRACVNSGQKPKYYVTGCLPTIVEPALFDHDVKLAIGKLAIWRLETHAAFGGFVNEQQKPDCPLIGENGNVYNLVGIASRTLKENGLDEQAREMRDRVFASGSYDEALCVIGDYVNITAVGEEEEMEQEFGGM